MLCLLGGAIVWVVRPEILEDLRTFGEHEEGKYESQDGSGDTAADGSNGIGNCGAEIIEINKVLREIAYGFDGLLAKVIDMERFAKIVDKGEIIGGAVDYIGQIAGKFRCFGDDGWNDDGDKATNEADDNEIGEGNGDAARFARE